MHDSIEIQYNRELKSLETLLRKVDRPGDFFVFGRIETPMPKVEIESRNLDMTHVTERRGSPHTLVCTKTRAGFQRRCKQYTDDVAAMQVLLEIHDADLQVDAPTMDRLRSACARMKQWTPAPAD